LQFRWIFVIETLVKWLEFEFPWYKINHFVIRWLVINFVPTLKCLQD